MDDFQDAERPPKNTPKYLPRVWKAQPDPEPEVPSKKKRKKGDSGADDSAGGTEPSAKSTKGGKTKGAKTKGGDPDKKKGALVEETPTFDTYEARQTARIIAGVVIAGISVLSLFVIFWMATGSKEEKTADDEALLAQKPSQDPAQAEREARFMFNRAREVVKNGNVKLTVAFLQKVSQSYPRTSAGQDAGAALALPQGELADYLEKATGPTSAPSGPSRPVAVATGPAPPPAAATKGGPEAPPKSAPPNPQVAVNPTGPSPPTEASPKVATGPAPPLPTAPAPPMNTPGASGTPTGPSASSPMPVTAAANEPNAKALPQGFRRSPEAGVSANGWPLQIVGERDGATMVLVPGGNYRMGRDDGESSEGPTHRVVLGTYYIDQHEVTVRQFDVFQKQDGLRSDRARALLKVQATANDSDDAPVTMVTARDAKDYATWAGKRLPTEAQWEIAARSADGRLFPWGNEESQGDKPREFRKVEPIRSYPRDLSPFGAFDMAGNAWEWTNDWFDSKYYQQFRNTPADNPTGAAKTKAEQLVVRGCAKNGAITKREGLRWNTRLPYLGFRCVLPVEGPGNAFEGPAPAAGQPAPNGVRNPNAGPAPF